MRDHNLQAMLTKAKTAHQAGDLAGARNLRRDFSDFARSTRRPRRASAVATQAGRLDAATVLCRRALVLAPASIGVALRLGLLLNHGNHVTAAAHAFERVMTIEPDHYAASHNAQVARLRASHAAAAAVDWKAAIAHATRAIRTAPTHHIPRRELGLIAQQAEPLDLARSALTRAAILELSDPETLNRLGYVAFGSHNIDRAERYFRFGAIIAPSYANAHIGQAEWQLGAVMWRPPSRRRTGVRDGPGQRPDRIPPGLVSVHGRRTRAGAAALRGAPPQIRQCHPPRPTGALAGRGA